MKTLEQEIRRCIEDGKKAFIPYIMAGDGGLDSLHEKILFLQEIGVTAIEIGIPFSDPVADGEVIQKAGERSIALGTTLRKVLYTLSSFKEEVHVPVIIMSYLNPILSIGATEFVEICQASGVSGLIVPDLPLEESALLAAVLEEKDIALIQLVSLTSSTERIKRIAENAEGFIYAVTVKGITGIRKGFDSDLSSYLERIKQNSPVPVLAGFGVSFPEHIEQLNHSADGVIVGSAIVDAFYREDRRMIQQLVNASIQRSNY
ncbi:tryptophan synthase subunit alpha [Sporosarcina contaminans]|uniref:Tryptophan synthase alpha chain n=1 Tax=Sporosarcina contaminans TaxID=633403 RepID=A0ABW3TYJ1_9BACL